MLGYHGTNNKFDQFDLTNGIWFISDKEEAAEYGERIIEAEVTLSNPLITTHKVNVTFGPVKLIKEAKARQHDGIILLKDSDFADEHCYTEANHDVVIAFRSYQIRVTK
jgi:hypothetical protein